METPLDVLSRAASFVHANEEESKFSHNATVPLVFVVSASGVHRYASSALTLPHPCGTPAL